MGIICLPPPKKKEKEKRIGFNNLPKKWWWPVPTSSFFPSVLPIHTLFSMLKYFPAPIKLIKTHRKESCLPYWPENYVSNLAIKRAIRQNKVSLLFFKVIFPKYCKNSNESCTFFVGRLGRQDSTKNFCSFAKVSYFWWWVFSYLHEQNKYKTLHTWVRTKKSMNIKGRKL